MRGGFVSRGRPARRHTRARGAASRDPAHRTRTYRAIRTAWTRRHRRTEPSARGTSRRARAPPPPRRPIATTTTTAPRALTAAKACEWTGQSSGAPGATFWSTTSPRSTTSARSARICACALASIRRSHRRQIVQHLRVQGIVEPRRLCPLPDLARPAGSTPRTSGVTESWASRFATAPHGVPIETHPFDRCTRRSSPTRATRLTAAEGRLRRFVSASDSTDPARRLNVAVASALCMHHFALWAGYEERAGKGRMHSSEKAVVSNKEASWRETRTGGAAQGGRRERRRRGAWEDGTRTGRWASSFDRSH